MAQTPISPTVAALIADCCRKKYQLGAGLFGTTYSMAHIPGLDPYVLRVSHTSDGTGMDGDNSRSPKDTLATLASSTCLTTPAQIATGINLGQQLLHVQGDFGDDKPIVGIYLRQPGESLASLRSKYTNRLPQDDTLRTIAGHVAMLHDILRGAEQAGRNPFVSILRQEQEIRRLGYTPQLDASNILFDKESGTLRLVDQLSHRVANESTLAAIFNDKAKYYLHDLTVFDHYPNPALEVELRQATAAISRLIKYAQRIVATEQENAANGHPSKPLFIMRALPSAQVVRLDDPPAVLIEQLKQLHGQLNLSAR